LRDYPGNLPFLKRYSDIPISREIPRKTLVIVSVISKDPSVFLVHGHTLFPTTIFGIPDMAEWFTVPVILIMVLSILTAGCFTTSTDTPPVPTMSTLPIPGVTSNPAQILQSIGEVIGQGTPGGIIDTITVTVSLSDLSKPIDMEKMRVIYSDVVRTESIQPVEGYWGEPPQGYWSIIRVENEIGGPNNLLESGEQFVIRVNPKAPVVPTQLITIQLIPAGGSPLSIRRVAPKTIRAENILDPV